MTTKSCIDPIDRTRKITTKAPKTNANLTLRYKYSVLALQQNHDRKQARLVKDDNLY